MITEVITGVVAAANLVDGYVNRNSKPNPDRLKGGDEYFVIEGNFLDFANIVTGGLWMGRLAMGISESVATYAKNFSYEEFSMHLINNPELILLLCAGAFVMWVGALAALAASELIAYVMVEVPSWSSKMFRSGVRSGFRGIEKSLTDIKPIHS